MRRGKTRVNRLKLISQQKGRNFLLPPALPPPNVTEIRHLPVRAEPCLEKTGAGNRAHNLLRTVTGKGAGELSTASPPPAGEQAAPRHAKPGAPPAEAPRGGQAAAAIPTAPPGARGLSKAGPRKRSPHLRDSPRRGTGTSQGWGRGSGTREEKGERRDSGSGAESQGTRASALTSRVKQQEPRATTSAGSCETHPAHAFLFCFLL